MIERNERMNEVGPDKIIDQANQLLSFDKKFYQVKKKLFDYNEYSDITRKLYQQKDHQFKGVVSAIAVRYPLLYFLVLGDPRLHVRWQLCGDH